MSYGVRPNLGVVLTACRSSVLPIPKQNKIGTKYIVTLRKSHWRADPS